MLLFPPVTFAKALLSDINLNEKPDGRIEIDIEASSSYKYLVHAIKNDLIIELDAAGFNNSIIEKFRNNGQINANIASIDFEENPDGSAKIIIHTKKLTDFKFYISAKTGIATPYGFDKQVIKTNQKSNAIKQPKIYAPKEKIEKQNLRYTSNTEPLSTESDLFMPDDISNHSAKKGKRLDTNNVVVPDGYFNKPEPFKEREVQEIKPPLRAEKKEVLVQDEPKVEKNIINKPVPISKLIETLNNDDIEESNIPKLTEENNFQDASTEEAIKSGALTQKSMTNNEPEAESFDENSSIIASIKQIPNGSKNKPLVLTPKGSKTVNGDAAGPAFEKNYPVKSELESSIAIKSRDLIYLPLGLSEEFLFDETPVENIEIPIPKSGMTSDGDLAFTVITPEGSYEKRAPIQKINPVSNDSYSYSVSSDNRVIDVSEQFNEKDKLKLKRLIMEAKDLYNLGNSAEAEIKYKQAITLNPKRPWGYIAIAGLYETDERFNDAIMAYNEAIKYLPDKVELLYNIALDYYRVGNFTNAENYLNKVISSSPNFVLAYYNLGTLYYKLSEYDKAVEYLQKAISLNPVLADAHYNLALAYLSLDKKQEALKSFEQCKNIDPFDKQCSQMVDKLK